MSGFIDYENEDHERRTRAFLGFLADLQQRLIPRTPAGAATVQQKAQDEPVPLISGTAGDGHPFEDVQ
jgi:hypothetical protein